MTAAQPTRKPRVLAVDFGDRRTGLAATDGSGTLVVPLPTLHGLDDTALARAIAHLADDRNSDVVVVGLPRNARGKIGARARRTLAFVDGLRLATAREVLTIDESMSTDEAHERLQAGGMRAAKRKSLADSVAAMVICERFLAERQPAKRAAPPSV